MKEKPSIILFNQKQVRRLYNEEKEIWYFSVIDIVAILTVSLDARNYWKVLKNRLKNEGSEVVTKCNQLKLIASLRSKL